MPKLGQELPSHTSYVWQILLAYFAGLMGPTLEHYELAEAFESHSRKTRSAVSGVGMSSAVFPTDSAS